MHFIVGDDFSWAGIVAGLGDMNAVSRAFILPPVRKSAVLAGEKVLMIGRLENTHLDILPFFPSVLKLIFF
jgi:hypothetical protein